MPIAEHPDWTGLRDSEGAGPTVDYTMNVPAGTVCAKCGAPAAVGIWIDGGTLFVCETGLFHNCLGET